MTNTPITTFVDDDAVVRRLYAYGRWKLETVAHFGGDETGVADMCLLRDAEGKPFIPGASITGVARSLLARQSQPWTDYKDGKETQELKDFFGGAGKDDTMSALIVADASCVSEQVMVSIRDGVRVDTQSGSAADKAKFDVEVLEPGTEFEVSVECVIRAGDNQSKFEKLFFVLLHIFQQGEVHLGARTRRGYGRGKVASWEIRDLQMNSPKDIAAWLSDEPWARPKSALGPRALPADQRCHFCIDAHFNLHTSLLIRSVSADPDAPDMVPLSSNAEPVVPGTSFAGAFRHRAALIANILGWHDRALDEMFGPVHEQQRANQQSELWASRVWIEEHLVENVKEHWQDRVAIDRFTGGSLQSALFNEKPVYPISMAEESTSNVRLILSLEEPEKAEIGLLLLTLRDFWHGHTALGGETSIGRGTLSGIKAQVWFKDSDAPDANIWNFSHQDECMTLDGDDTAFIECCIKEAQDYSGFPAGSRRPDK
ncbi:hypothetical protein C6496_18715 [Candidatus Poribacteria bacterium]|nr:MAG: hypothetical protein C6496_18715 [Candidatus Poribacteria bacterium]